MEHFDWDLEAVQSRPQPEPCNSEWLAGRIALIFSAYRRDEWTDPESFTVQLGLNLERFPREIVEYVTDPVTGIQARSKWPPSLSEIVDACLAEKAHREKLAKYAKLPPTRPTVLEAPKFSAEDNYEAMFKKHGRPIGVFEEGRTIPYRG